MISLLVALAKGDDIRLVTTNVTVNVAVPDASPVGVASTMTIGGMVGPIESVTVHLDITGGFNGDLYAYLLSPHGEMVVLLNRVGVNSGNAFGAGDSGFNITLDSASGNNIHDASSGSGQLTGTWAPDSRNIDPLAIQTAFDANPAGSTLVSLDGFDPNGLWTLYLADVSVGGESAFVSWGLTIITVPEPQTWTLFGGSLAAFWMMNRRRK